ncbi:MAG TPA: SulP family inorganic anion transporter, partial [Aquificaceae bacterium]|nr:SulP family inorganic anion transporter [Aquificaceae bacterium]
DLWVAVTLGVLLSLGSFVYRTMYPRIVVLSRDPESGTFVNAERKNLPQCPQILYIRPNMSIYFGNAQHIFEYIVDKVKEKLREGGLKFVLIDMEAVNYIDATGSETVIRLIKVLREMGVEASFANIGCDVYPLLENAGFDKIVKHELVFDSKGQSIVELFEKIDHGFCRKECPYVVFKECAGVKGAL